APASGLMWFAVTGIGNGLATLTMFAAVRHGPITLVAPIVAIFPLVTLLLSTIVLKHFAITPRVVGGTVLTVAGVALVRASGDCCAEVKTPLRRPACAGTREPATVPRLPEHFVKSPVHLKPYPHPARLILILSLAPTIGLGIGRFAYALVL